MERSDFINQIISKYQLENPRYLEIGVCDGRTFRKVNTLFKEGVDPDCIYPVTYKQTSDDFFAQNPDRKYDLIFIDGLHCAYQVQHDIFNSINALNPSGIIVMDDVYPHHRKEQLIKPVQSGAWTGDVWKSVYHSFDEIIELSETLHFTKGTQRGMFAFRVRKDNVKNITIDNTIPKDKEWERYLYEKDFPDYLEKINKSCTPLNDE